MEIFGIDYFSLDGVARVSGTEHIARSCIFRLGVARLNHEILDYTVKQHAIVVSVAHELEDVVAMLGCVVVEGNLYVAERCVDEHTGAAVGD